MGNAANYYLDMYVNVEQSAIHKKNCVKECMYRFILDPFL